MSRVFMCLFVPDVSNLWSVLEEPAIRNFVLPTHVPGVFPQETYLVRGMSCVPEGVSQILTRSCLRLDHLVVKTHRIREGKTILTTDEDSNNLTDTP